MEAVVEITSMKKVTVSLVQINNSFSGQNYLPYSVACLQSFVEKNSEDPSRYNFPLPIYKRIGVEKAVSRLMSAHVVGFSCYVWNAEISLKIASRLKQECPNVLIVFGGPHVPNNSEEFLRDYSFVDVLVHNEGERTFLNLLEEYPRNDWSKITGISYLDDFDAYVKTEETPRLKDLSEVPSPFLEGTFDELMASNPQENWIGLWESNRGCPFQCTYCDWGSATAAKVTKYGMDRLYRELDWFINKKIAYVFVCDANFGIQKRDVELARYVAGLREKTGYPDGFSVQNTKNATERAYETQKILSDAGLNKGVALSMQSLNPIALKNVKRDNISLDSYFELAKRFTKDGVETYSDLILALPGETYETFCEGINKLILSGQHNRIQFNNLSILPNSEMGDADYLKKFGMKTVRSEIINIHGSREIGRDDVTEFQSLVIETASMPADDWVKTRAFCWMIAFLHFNKVFQLPLILVNQYGGLNYHHMVEEFMSVEAAKYPTIGRIRDLYIEEARSIQRGGPEYIYSEEWLGIYWPADEYALIQMTMEHETKAFYNEAQALLEEMLKIAGAKLPDGALSDAVNLNMALVSQPFVEDDCECNIRYDLLTYWDEIREGREAELVLRDCLIKINRKHSAYRNVQDWCREVVWWGNKKGAYLYSARTNGVSPQLAGHF